MNRRISGYTQDEEGDWIAQLECGHRQHVRHKPPWINREWVTTPEGRSGALGMILNCNECDREAP
ncbi:MAG TPA: DUF3565 domain-containing protein [Steroidobacteraceae bacterium]|jgi:hypothetical protein